MIGVGREFGDGAEPRIPIQLKTGTHIWRGSSEVARTLRMATSKPNGTHINMTKVATGVGLKANLPSWKINGFGYFSLGRTCQFFFSASLTK